MDARAHVTPLPALSTTPDDLLSRWAPNARLCVMHSARSQKDLARWSVFAEPAGDLNILAGTIQSSGQIPQCCSDLIHDSATTHTTTNATTLATTRSILQAIQESAQATLTTDDTATTTPFATGWMMALNYELGCILEPAARRAALNPDTPVATFFWCPDALVYDRIQQQWLRVRRLDAPSSPEIDRLVASASSATSPGPQAATDRQPEPTSVGQPTDMHWSTDDYLHAVETTRDYIAAGDIFQANITRQIGAEWSGSTRDLARVAFQTAEPWYGAYLENSPTESVISLSPELFLSYDAEHRRVITRPIKGTRPSGDDADVLRDSAKDDAELAMIVDLMRNDLGRVCAFGSVEVPFGRVIETHPTVHHGVAEVRGILRDDVGFSDVLQATFPPGSITGAPKIRAMQIIEELEPCRRGIYCGSIGWLSAHGDFMLNVAIRTMTVSGTRPDGRWDALDGRVIYGAGGGIVADSDPLDEYRETVTKTSVFVDTLQALRSAGRQAQPLSPGDRSSAEAQMH